VIPALAFLPSLIPFWARWAILAGAVAVAAALVWRSGANHVQAKWDLEKREMAIQQGEANMRAAQAGFRHLEWVAANTPRAAKRREKLDHAITQSPDWGSQPVPDGVRDAIAAALADDPS